MQQLFSPTAPPPVGPYSHAVRVGNSLYCSGQTPIHPDTLKIEHGDIEAQTAQVIDNLGLVLTTENLTLKNIVKVNVYISDMELFNRMNVVYARYFNEHKPARTTVAVNGLPYNALVEMDCMAVYP